MKPLTLLSLPEGVEPVEDWPGRLTQTQEDVEEQRALLLERRRASWLATVPLRFREASLASLTTEQGAGQARRFWTEDVLTLVLRSDKSGVGKSHAAYAVGHDAVEHGAWAIAYTMIGLNDAMRPGGPQGAWDAALACDLLVVDDVGREKITEWTLERFQELLDVRWSNERRTVLTTNLSGQAFLDRYGDPIADRVQDRAWIVTATGKTRRVTAPW